MSQHIMETVLFKLVPGTSHEDFERAAHASSRYVESCSGFIARRLSCSDDGTWIEQIEWASLNDARSAAAGIGTSEHTQNFVKAIDGGSVRLLHSTLTVSIN